MPNPRHRSENTVSQAAKEAKETPAPFASPNDLANCAMRLLEALNHPSLEQEATVVQMDSVLEAMKARDIASITAAAKGSTRPVSSRTVPLPASRSS